MTKKPSETLEEFEQETVPEVKAKKVVKAKSIATEEVEEFAIDDSHYEYTHHAYSIAKLQKEDGSERWGLILVELDIKQMHAKEPQVIFEEIHRDLVTEKFRILVAQKVL